MKESKKVSNIKETLPLNLEAIDTVAEYFYASTEKSSMDRRDRLRLRLFLEEVLQNWMNSFPEETDVTYSCTRLLGRSTIRISVKGPESNPLEQTNEEEEEQAMMNALLASSDLGFTYTYKNGKNVLTLRPPIASPKSQAISFAVVLCVAIILGVITRLCPESVQTVASSIASPLFDTLMGILRTIAGPMIFLAICWGILNLGSVSSIGKIAKRTLGSMVLAMLLVGIGTILLSIWFFPLGSGDAAQGSAEGLYSIYQLFLGIFPTNIVTPFAEGNMLQIIFLAVCSGIALLILGDKVSSLRNVVEQANQMVNLLMAGIGKLVPVFVFFSVYNLMLSDFGDQIIGAVYFLGITIVCCYISIAIYFLIVASKYKIKYSYLIKKLAKTHLIALTTASSSAAFATNIETCEKELGISPKLTHFGVPMGQVIFMPGATINFIAAALSMALVFGVSINITWLIVLLVVSVLLSMAASPVPGGALTFYSALMLQMGIPSAALAIVLSLDMLTDYIATANCLTCLQLQLIMDADKLNLLDKDVLLAPPIEKKKAS